MLTYFDPLPDRHERPLPGDYNMARAPKGAYVPREVPTVDPREVEACAAAWAGLDDDAIAAGAAMSADPVAYRARVARGVRQ
jgi:hypothetical protein